MLGLKIATYDFSFRRPCPTNITEGNNAEQWSSANKFAVVLETASLNEAELAQYCRKKGLYSEQIAM